MSGARFRQLLPFGVRRATTRTLGPAAVSNIYVLTYLEMLFRVCMVRFPELGHIGILPGPGSKCSVVPAEGEQV